MKLIKNWAELAKVTHPEGRYELDINIKDGNGHIRPLFKVNEGEYFKHNWYLSTHTFYGNHHEQSTKLLQSLGFDVVLDNWDKEDVIELTKMQIEKMKHAIGLGTKKAKHNKYVPYRNDYVTPLVDDKDWKRLTEVGYAIRVEKINIGIMYRVTREGMDYLERIFGIEIKEDGDE